MVGARQSALFDAHAGVWKAAAMQTASTACACRSTCVSRLTGVVAFQLHRLCPHMLTLPVPHAISEC